MKVYNEDTGAWDEVDLSKIDELLRFPDSTHPVPFKGKDTDYQAREYSKEYNLQKANQSPQAKIV
ncbi:MAG TPA: hypothetical protein VD905_15320 [Flavobacteriales bacterium]|nr:hypothetical protein [Flavobacteriales bacterium]